MLRSLSYACCLLVLGCDPPPPSVAVCTNDCQTTDDCCDEQVCTGSGHCVAMEECNGLSCQSDTDCCEAQSCDLSSGRCARSFAESAEANAATTQVTLTLLGIPARLSFPPANQANESGVGAQDQQAGSITAGLPALQVIALQDSEDTAIGTATPLSEAVEGTSEIGHVSLLNGLVVIHGMVADVSCDATSAGAHCNGSTALSQLLIGGQLVPATDPAPNTSVPVIGTLSIGGFTLPVNFTLLLNEQLRSDDDVGSESLTINGAHLIGSAELLGLVSVTVDITIAGPHGSEIDCSHQCEARCAKSSRHKICLRACGTCCSKFHCVPPGTSGNEDVCPAYANARTHGGKHKCP